MIPSDALRREHLRDFQEASQVNALTPRSDEFLLHHRRVANANGRVGHVLQETRRIRSARVWVLVPAAVGVVHAPQAVVVTFVAHHEVYLSYPVVRRHIQSLPLKSTNKSVKTTGTKVIALSYVFHSNINSKPSPSFKKNPLRFQNPISSVICTHLMHVIFHSKPSIFFFFIQTTNYDPSPKANLFSKWILHNCYTLFTVQNRKHPATKSPTVVSSHSLDFKGFGILLANALTTSFPFNPQKFYSYLSCFTQNKIPN